MVSETQRDWEERLPAVMAAYRASRHEATGFTPNKLFLGREVHMPIDLVMGLPAEEVGLDQTTDDYVRRMQAQMADAFAIARQHLGTAAERRKATYDMHVKEHGFKEGDWVWYWYPCKYSSRSLKWKRSYTGPYLVIRKIEPVNFVLQRSPKSKPFVVYVNKIKKCFGELPVSWVKPEHGLARDTVQSLGSTFCLDVETPKEPVPYHNAFDHMSEPEPAKAGVLGRRPVRHRHPPQYLTEYMC